MSITRAACALTLTFSLLANGSLISGASTRRGDPDSGGPMWRAN